MHSTGFTLAPNHHGIRRSRLAGTAGLLLSLLAGLLWLGSAPSHAAGGTWSLTGILGFGCASAQWELDMRTEGFAEGTYVWHTRVIVDSKVYMNEQLTGPAGDDQFTWNLYPDFTYGVVESPGTWPIAPGRPMKVVFALEQPKGTVVSSWTMVAASCDSATLLYNGPTAADLDEDYLVAPADRCPTLRATTTNGCPLRDRSLSLRARYGPRRVVGRLHSAGHPALHAGRTVTIWKARPGPDRRFAVRTTTSRGTFKARVGQGRYYATSPGLLVATAGQVSADRSLTVRVR